MTSADRAQTDLWGSRLERQWKEWDVKNPAVYPALVALTREAQRRRRKFGIKAIFEIFRWERRHETEGDEYKINNNFAPFYARRIMAENDDLAGFFDTRESIADEVPF